MATNAGPSPGRRNGIWSTTPIDSVRNGSFRNPRSYADFYPPESKLHIFWNSTSSNIKLILYQRGEGGEDASWSYIPSAQQQEAKLYVWTVERVLFDSYSSPYVFRGLDAGADEGYQTNDFWTPMFYIGDAELESILFPSRSTSSTSSSRTQGFAKSRFSTSIASSTPTFHMSTTSTARPTTDSSLRDTYSTQGNSWQRNEGDLSTSSASVLIIVIILLIIGVIMVCITKYFNRLQRKEAEKPKLVPVNTSDDELMSGGAHDYTAIPGASPVEMEVSPTELEITPVEVEGTRMVAEMDARREVPRVEDLDELVV